MTPESSGHLATSSSSLDSTMLDSNSNRPCQAHTKHSSASSELSVWQTGHTLSLSAIWLLEKDSNRFGQGDFMTDMFFIGRRRLGLQAKSVEQV